MKIIVIGGSGFLGKELLKLLTVGNEIINYDIQEKSWNNTYTHKLDITDQENVLSSLNHANCIINLAAVHSDNVKDKNLYYEVNVNGAKNICKAAVKNNVQNQIFISSVAVYGHGLNLSINSKLNPFNDYGKSKVEAEKVYLDWYKQDPKNRNLCIVRPTVIFGPENKGNVHNLIKQINEKKFLMIGNGNNKKSICYVKNISYFINKIIDTNFRGLKIYNYADKPDLTMNELVKLIKNKLNIYERFSFKLPVTLGLMIGYFFDLFGKLLNKNFAISAIRIKKFISDSVVETNTEELGNVSYISLDDAIVETIKQDFIKNEKK
jgi:nucleoside-diphosphate-sugar epimerase